MKHVVKTDEWKSKLSNKSSFGNKEYKGTFAHFWQRSEKLFHFMVEIIHSEINMIHFEHVFFKGKVFSKFDNRNQLVQTIIGFLSCGQIGILEIV